jgi:hypothetical protein
LALHSHTRDVPHPIHVVTQGLLLQESCVDAVMCFQESLRTPMLSEPSVLQTPLNQLLLCCELLPGCCWCNNSTVVDGSTAWGRGRAAISAVKRALQAVKACFITVTLLC